jgi:hypothetical protein
VRSRVIALAALGLLLVWQAYTVGHRAGLRACPEAARAEVARQERMAAEWAEIMAEPDGRELVCQRVFDLVGDEIAEEKRLEAQDMEGTRK